MIGSVSNVANTVTESVKSPREQIDDKSVYFVDQTSAGIHFVEVLKARRSNELGRSDSRVIYWKKAKAFILEDQQLFKVCLVDFKRTRFGVDLTRIQLEKLKEFMTIVVLGKLYIIGGKRNGEPVSEVFEVDLKYRTVFPVESLKTARYNAFIMSDKKNIYCLGGTTIDGPNHAVFEKYDCTTKTWSSLAPLDPKFEPKLCINDKHFISCFGENKKEFMKYIIEDDRWVQESSAAVPKDILSYTNVCVANQSKFTMLGRAVRESSNLDLLHFDQLTNK